MFFYKMSMLFTPKMCFLHNGLLINRSKRWLMRLNTSLKGGVTYNLLAQRTRACVDAAVMQCANSKYM